MLTYSAKNYKKFAKHVMDNGQRSESRQGPVIEMLGVTFMVDDFVISDPARKYNWGFANIELYSLVSGRDEIELFTQHIKCYGKFSQDGKRLDNSYGSRNTRNGNQIFQCARILKRDKDSRQAVFSIYDGSQDLYSTSEHIPCTLSIHWMVRNAKLHQFVTMRSNDVYIGLTYDTFVFGMLHRAMANEIGVGLGDYRHTAHSLHVYERDIDKIERMSDEPIEPVSPAPGTLTLEDICTRQAIAQGPHFRVV